jgi:hypothetical protein
MKKLTVIAMVTRFFKLVLAVLIGLTMAGGMANAGDKWHRDSHKHRGKDKQVKCVVPAILRWKSLNPCAARLQSLCHHR